MNITKDAEYQETVEYFCKVYKISKKQAEAMLLDIVLSASDGTDRYKNAQHNIKLDLLTIE